MRLVGTLSAAVWLVGLAGCREDGKPDGVEPEPDSGTATQGADEDGDGFSAAQGDCDDGDAAINPNAPEVCDGVDQDCDGEADDGLGAVWYADTDEDGRGDSGAAAEGCARPEGYVEDGTDCDDGDATV